MTILDTILAMSAFGYCVYAGLIIITGALFYIPEIQYALFVTRKTNEPLFRTLWYSFFIPVRRIQIFDSSNSFDKTDNLKSVMEVQHMISMYHHNLIQVTVDVWGDGYLMQFKVNKDLVKNHFKSYGGIRIHETKIELRNNYFVAPPKMVLDLLNIVERHKEQTKKNTKIL